MNPVMETTPSSPLSLPSTPPPSPSSAYSDKSEENMRKCIPMETDRNESLLSRKRAYDENEQDIDHKKIKIHQPEETALIKILKIINVSQYDTTLFQDLAKIKNIKDDMDNKNTIEQIMKKKQLSNILRRLSDILDKLSQEDIAKINEIVTTFFPDFNTFHQCIIQGADRLLAKAKELEDSLTPNMDSASSSSKTEDDQDTISYLLDQLYQLSL
ncbi:MAG: hypothetical protein HAW62_02340 [Endozoicomonadaceae bacterium]|nr:hypothetical protein [Endozoicomonadaceae bacterium]